MRKIWGWLFASVFCVSLVSALNLSYYSPAYLLNNQWILFGLIFVIFFAFLFYLISRSIKERNIAAIISGIIALFIAAAFVQRSWFYGIAGETIGTWFLLLALLVAFLFGIKMLYDRMGAMGISFALIVLWAIFYFVDPINLLPASLYYQYYRFTYSVFGTSDIVSNFWTLGILIGFFIITLFWRSRAPGVSGSRTTVRTS